MTNTEKDPYKSLREFYDNEYYCEINEQDSRLSWHYRTIGSRIHLPADAHVLDVACGTGEWLGYFQQRGAQISGIDISTHAIERCKKRLPTGSFVCGPAENLPFPSHSFDLVTCMGSLEHFMHKPLALKEMNRVARPGASVLILVPNAGFLTRRLGLYHGTEQAKVQEEVFELDQWETLLQDAGFRIVERWRDLHPISWRWIRQGAIWAWPHRALQAFVLALWPLKWQYQVYFYCESK